MNTYYYRKSSNYSATLITVPLGDWKLTAIVCSKYSANVQSIYGAADIEVYFLHSNLSTKTCLELSFLALYLELLQYNVNAKDRCSNKIFKGHLSPPSPKIFLQN